MTKLQFEKKLCALLDRAKMSEQDTMQALGEFFALAVVNTASGNKRADHKHFKASCEYVRKMMVELYANRMK